MDKLATSTFHLSTDMLNHLRIGVRTLVAYTLEENFEKVDKIENKLRKQLSIIEEFVEDDLIQADLNRVGIILDIIRAHSEMNVDAKLALLNNLVFLVNRLSYEEIILIKNFIESIEEEVNQGDSNLNKITLGNIKKKMNIIGIKSCYYDLFTTSNFMEVYDVLSKSPHEVLVEVFNRLRLSGKFDKLSDKEKVKLRRLYDERLPF